MDYNLPDTLDSSKSADYVLNFAPAVISDLRNEAKKRGDLIDNRQAIIAIENKSEKQSAVKAMQQIDEQVQALRDEMRGFEVLLERWEKSFQSAKYFYKSLLGH